MKTGKRRYLELCSEYNCAFIFCTPNYFCMTHTCSECESAECLFDPQSYWSVMLKQQCYSCQAVTLDYSTQILVLSLR